jgi:two-component system LytT family response regulator
MRQYSCVIIEDEPLALEKVELFIQRHEQLYCAAKFYHLEEGWDYLLHHAIDIVFLDLNVGGHFSFDRLERDFISSKIVITSAYPQHALKGFELNVVDYLVKPFTYDRWEVAANRAIAALSVIGKVVSIKSEGRIVRIPIKDIIYIEGMDDYRRVHTTTHRWMTLQTFTQLEELLADTSMVRIHRSYMVNREHISSFNSKEVIIEKMSFPIAAGRKI